MIFLVIVAFRATLHTQTPAPVPGIVEGLALRTGTMEPIEGARITLISTSDSASVFAVSGANGHFKFTNVPPGRFVVTARREGFLRNGADSGPLDTVRVTGNLESNGHVEDLRVYFVEPGVISGRVLDANGKPAANVKMEAVQKGYFNGIPTLMDFGQGTTAVSSQTDDRGEYRLISILPGDYFVRSTLPVSGSGNGFGRGGRPDALPERFYFPATHDPLAASIVHVRSGNENRGVDLNLPSPDARHTVSGTIHDDVPGLTSSQLSFFVVPQKPVAETNSTPSNSPFVLDAGTGGFSISGIPPGTFNIFAVVRRGTYEYDSGWASVDVRNFDVTNVNIVVRHGVDIHGLLRVNGEAPGGRVGNTMIGLGSLDGLPSSALRVGGQAAGAPANRDTGEFTMLNVPSGDYRFRPATVLPPDFYIAGVHYGITSVYDDKITVGGGKTETLFVDIRTPGEIVRGIASDSQHQGAPGAVVVLVPGSSRRLISAEYKSVQADKDGHFSLTGVAPGEYKLFAWDFVSSTEWQNPDFIAVFESLGQPITVGTGPHPDVSVTVTSTYPKPSR